MAKVELTTTQEGDWLVFNLKSIQVEVKYPVAQYHQRNVTTVLESPEGKVTRIAVPLHAGAGPQPENTMTTVGIQDIIRDLTHMIEQVVSETEKKEEKGTW